MFCRCFVLLYNKTEQSFEYRAQLFTGPPPPLEFAKLNIADNTGNEKISYFSYLCTSTVIRQTESILLKVGAPSQEIFSGSAPECLVH